MFGLLGWRIAWMSSLVPPGAGPSRASQLPDALPCSAQDGGWFSGQCGGCCVWKVPLLAQ